MNWLLGQDTAFQKFSFVTSWYIYNRFWTKLELVQSTTSTVGWCYKEFIVLSLVVNVGWWWISHFRIGGGERLEWWMSGVVNVQFYKGGGERLGWWTSGVVNVWVVNVLQSLYTSRFQLMVSFPNHDVIKNLTGHRIHEEGPQIF